MATTRRVAIRPIYDSSPTNGTSGWSREDNSKFFSLPKALGRVSLSRSYWRNCPFQCSIEQPCKEHCQQVRKRKNIEILSREMVILQQEQEEVEGVVYAQTSHSCKNPHLIDWNRESFCDICRGYEKKTNKWRLCPNSCEIRLRIGDFQEGRTKNNKPWMQFLVSLESRKAVVTPHQKNRKRKRIRHTPSSSESDEEGNTYQRLSRSPFDQYTKRRRKLFSASTRKKLSLEKPQFTPFPKQHSLTFIPFTSSVALSTTLGESTNPKRKAKCLSFRKDGQEKPLVVTPLKLRPVQLFDDDDDDTKKNFSRKTRKPLTQEHTTPQADDDQQDDVACQIGSKSWPVSIKASLPKTSSMKETIAETTQDGESATALTAEAPRILPNSVGDHCSVRESAPPTKYSAAMNQAGLERIPTNPGRVEASHPHNPSPFIAEQEAAPVQWTGTSTTSGSSSGVSATSISSSLDIEEQEADEHQSQAVCLAQQVHYSASSSSDSSQSLPLTQEELPKPTSCEDNTYPASQELVTEQLYVPNDMLDAHKPSPNMTHSPLRPGTQGSINEMSSSLFQSTQGVVGGSYEVASTRTLQIQHDSQRYSMRMPQWRESETSSGSMLDPNISTVRRAKDLSIADWRNLVTASIKGSVAHIISTMVIAMNTEYNEGDLIALPPLLNGNTCIREGKTVR